MLSLNTLPNIQAQMKYKTQPQAITRSCWAAELLIALQLHQILLNVSTYFRRSPMKRLDLVDAGWRHADFSPFPLHGHKIQRGKEAVRKSCGLRNTHSVYKSNGTCSSLWCADHISATKIILFPIFLISSSLRIYMKTSSRPGTQKLAAAQHSNKRVWKQSGSVEGSKDYCVSDF